MLKNKINLVDHLMLVGLTLWYVCVDKNPCLHQDKHKKTEMVKWRTTWFYMYNCYTLSITETLAGLRSDASESGSGSGSSAVPPEKVPSPQTYYDTVEPWFNGGPRVKS